MDIKALHQTYAGGSGLAAATALIQASGEAHPSINSNHVSDAIRKHSSGATIAWPLVLRELKRSPGFGEQ